MKRRNVQEAFVGEPTGRPTGALDNYADGDEAVDIEVRSGKVMLTVPAGTPDDQVFESQSFLGGELELEDGRVLSFEIQGGAVGAQATGDQVIGLGVITGRPWRRDRFIRGALRATSSPYATVIAPVSPGASGREPGRRIWVAAT